MKERVLQGPWHWAFYIASLAARLPLSAVPVVLLLGTLEGGDGVADAGGLLAAIAIGAAVSGLVQGPAWDRLPQSALLLVLAFLSNACLLLLMLSFETTLGIFLAAAYGFLRPHTSTITRSTWMNVFKDDGALSARSVSLDVSSTPVLSVLGPLGAGALFYAWGLPGALATIAAIALVAAISMAALIRGQKRVANPSSVFSSMRHFFTHPPLLTIMILAFFLATSSGVVTVLLSANLESRGALDLLSPMLALNALAILIGAYLFKKFIRLPGKHFHLLILLEATGLFLYAGGFIASLPVLWLMVFLGGFVVAPLSTVLYLLVENRSQDGDRSASFSLLATAQFTGVSAGQFIFSQLATIWSTEASMLLAGALQSVCLLAWIMLPYGMKRYRLQKTFSWWPEDLEDMLQGALDPGGSLAPKVMYGQVHRYLQNSLQSGEVPDLPRSLRQRGDHGRLLYEVVKLSWDDAWLHRGPSLDDVLLCGEWLQRNNFTEGQIKSMALYLGFEHRDAIHSVELTKRWDEAGSTPRLFATIFHLSRLRGSRMYAKMIDWEKTSRAPEEEGFIEILHILARTALGEPLPKKRFQDIWNTHYQSASKNGRRTWEHTQSMEHLFILLDTVQLSLDQPGHAQLLEKLSKEYLDLNTDYAEYVVWAFRARAERMLGQHRSAKRSILQAYDCLDVSENHRSNVFFVEQFDSERMLIDSALGAQAVAEAEEKKADT